MILSKYLPLTYHNNQNLLSILWIITTHSFKLYKSNSETLINTNILKPHNKQGQNCLRAEGGTPPKKNLIVYIFTQKIYIKV